MGHEPHVGDIFKDTAGHFTSESDLDIYYMLMCKDRIKLLEGGYTKESFWSAATLHVIEGCGLVGFGLPNSEGGNNRLFGDDEVRKLWFVANLEEILIPPTP